MNFLELTLLSIGLAMDAFAVSLTEGISMECFSKKIMLKVAIIFGFFQGVMPYIGWNIGNIFSEKFSHYNHIISFFLLMIVGIKMIYDGYKGEDEENKNCTSFFKLIILGIATSLDALIIGFSLALNKHLNIYFTVEIISIITFLISASGVYLGYKMGQFISWKTEYIGGVILIILAFKNLI